MTAAPGAGHRLVPWPDLLASALVGTARSGEQAEPLLELAAAQALRRRAGIATDQIDELPVPAPLDEVPPVAGAAAARADALLALDAAARNTTPVRDMARRVELLTEWLGAAAAAGRRLPPELVPMLLDAARRHRSLRPWIAPVAGPLAGWLATQRPSWSYASATPPAPPPDEGAEPADDWELGPIGHRVAALHRLRRRDPAAARDRLAAAWAGESPDDRAALLGVLATGLGADDEPLLERALDDRRRQVRLAALELLARLPDSGYARRMAERARACVDPAGRVEPPSVCDAGMRRDGITPKPPAGTGERAWWLEEILARTPLRTWPEPSSFRLAGLTDPWRATVRRGFARAAAAQADPVWAAALVDALTADVTANGRPDDRLLLEALYDALPAHDLAARAAAALHRGLAEATAIGVEHVLALCPRPWPEPVADAVFEALEAQLQHRTAAWRVAGICELAALRLPAYTASRAATLAERLRAARPHDPGLAAVHRFAATLRFRHDMLKELA